MQRPNGKWYRPRKPARAELLENDGGDVAKVLVIRCDDYETARLMAVHEIQAWDGGCTAGRPAFGWWREMLWSGQRQWVYDEVRGAPGYMFDIVYR